MRFDADSYKKRSKENFENVLKEFLHIDAETYLDGNGVIAVLGRKK